MILVIVTISCKAQNPSSRANPFAWLTTTYPEDIKYSSNTRQNLQIFLK